jgi:hypothetical protein
MAAPFGYGRVQHAEDFAALDLFVALSSYMRPVRRSPLPRLDQWRSFAQ